jgi:hypothetical protein
MKEKKAVVLETELLKFYPRLDWNWIAGITVPTDTSFRNLGRNLTQLAREVEQRDGTMRFRSLRIVPRKYEGPETMAYFAVGGLTPGSSFSWAERWNAIDAQSQSRCFPRYRAEKPYGARLAQIFDEIVGRKKIGADLICRLDIGLETISSQRKFKTHATGMPRDSRTNNRLAAARQLEIPFEES